MMAKITGALGALFSFLGMHGLSLGMVRDLARRFMAYMWGSFVALVSSKAAWAAVATVFVLGFSLGYGEGAFDRRSLRQEIRELRSAADASARETSEVIAKLEHDLEQARKQTTPAGALPALAVINPSKPKARNSKGTAR